MDKNKEYHHCDITQYIIVLLCDRHCRSARVKKLFRFYGATTLSGNIITQSGVMTWPNGVTAHLTSRCIVSCWHRANPLLLNLCHRDKHLALASSHAVTLHSKELPKHSKHKEGKRGLNQPYLHLPNGGGIYPTMCAKKQNCIFNVNLQDEPLIGETKNKFQWYKPYLILQYTII